MDRTAPWRAAAAGALVAALITLPGLGIGTLWDNSETAYGEVAREVLLYHDAIVMHFNGSPWFVQPPLYFWIAAFFAHWLGVTPFALRLPSALATVATSAWVGYAVARFGTARAAILSAVILSTTLMVAIVGRLAIMDALLDLAVAGAILSFALALRPRAGANTARPWIVAWVAMALGVLAKGPVAVVIAALVVLPWLLWERALGLEIARPKVRNWIAGVLLFVLLVAPWFLAVSLRAGTQATAQLIGHYSVGRYLGTIENQTGAIWYYLPVIVLGFFPWFAFLPPALWSAARAARSLGASGSLARLAVVWAVLPFLFFSLAQTKLPNYIALEFPAFAICVGLWFDGVAARLRRRAALAWTALVPVTIAGLAVAIGIFSRTMHLTADTHRSLGDLSLLGLIMVCGSVACFVLLVSAKTARLAPYSLAAATFVSVLVIALVAEPHVETLKPIPQLARLIRDQRAAGDAVAIQGVAGGNALVFYTAPKVATLDDGASPREGATDPRVAICGASRAFVITSVHRVRASTYGRVRHTLAVVDGDVLYLYDGPHCSGSST
ncbi:MAG: glycosyltransferase family 39 protein [Candidatus Eremiobacteraeota bacterium]|nr:glycosyltransferase family 39 protein [Candidatus Eremiobacteraeota bacterium]